MAEWVFEHGIGEDRAALIEGDAIIEAWLEPHGEAAKSGEVAEARLSEIITNKRVGRITLSSGEEALLQPLPDHLTEGALTFVEITRQAIAEPGRAKRALAKHMPKATEARPAPSMESRLAKTGFPAAVLPSYGADLLEEAGWSELLEQAVTGAVPFNGGALRISLTPAMTVIDVDGILSLSELARSGARASGKAIRALGVGGNIGIDLPTLEAKADRQVAVALFDDTLPQPFERTAINGFGFLQIVRRKTRPSLLEIAQYDQTTFAARALLRRTERTSGTGERTITAHPAVTECLTAQPDWLRQLERRVGATVVLAADPSLGLHVGHVSALQP